MAEFKSKYSVGDKVYVITDGSLVNDTDVELKEVTEVNFGGRHNTRYSLGYNTQRAESDVYTDLAEAKKVAIKRIKDKATSRTEYIQNKILKEAEVS